MSSSTRTPTGPVTVRTLHLTDLDRALLAACRNGGHFALPHALLLEIAARAAAPSATEPFLTAATLLETRPEAPAPPTEVEAAVALSGPGRLVVTIRAWATVGLHYAVAIQNVSSPVWLPPARRKDPTRARTPKPGVPTQPVGLLPALADAFGLPADDDIAVLRATVRRWRTDMDACRLPFLTLDALAHSAPSCPSAATAHVDLFTTCNDTELIRMFGKLEFMDFPTPDGHALAALAPNGRMLMRIRTPAHRAAPVQPGQDT
ncbi:hypothetical protein [Streptomyces sp. NPDC007205]|uniref:hypothetical protein n=1 Tax=Streptomyces sp. NPDC007205 TaxID=3154316 RepID=UPI0033C83290